MKIRGLVIIQNKTSALSECSCSSTLEELVFFFDQTIDAQTHSKVSNDCSVDARAWLAEIHFARFTCHGNCVSALRIFRDPLFRWQRLSSWPGVGELSSRHKTAMAATTLPPCGILGTDAKCRDCWRVYCRTRWSNVHGRDPLSSPNASIKLTASSHNVLRLWDVVKVIRINVCSHTQRFYFNRFSTTQRNRAVRVLWWTVSRCLVAIVDSQRARFQM